LATPVGDSTKSAALRYAGARVQRFAIMAVLMWLPACTDGRGRGSTAAEQPAAQPGDDGESAPPRAGGDRELARLERELAAQAKAVGRDDAGYAQAEHRLAQAEIDRDRCDRAGARLAHAADVLWRSDELLALVRVQADRGWCAVRGGDGADAREQYQRLLTLCREIDCPPALPAIGRFGLGQAAWIGGDRDGARRALAAGRGELAGLDADPDVTGALARFDGWLAAEAIQLPR
jgi:hypothetical protein